MIKRYIFISLALILLCRIGYLYYEVGRGMAGNKGEDATVFYGRATEIRKGTHLGNIRFNERLHKLSYRKVAGKPSAAGLFSEDKSHIRIFLRPLKNKNMAQEQGPVEMVLRDGRVDSMTSSTGESLKAIYLEPEEIDRIIGSKIETRRPVTLQTISPYLQNAVIAAEDSRFYYHIGIDPLAITRALFTNIREQRFAQGGSTITQQVAKNFFLSPQKTIGRKLREVELALALELRYKKKDILELYLNKIYLGQDGFQSIYGVENAAGFYFSKHAQDLSLEEAALLAGMIHAPNRYRNLKAARERRDAILAQMHHLKMIKEDEFNRASKAPVRIRSSKAPVHQTSYFVDYIQRITQDELGNEKPYHWGYRYYTTLDPVLQAAAEEAVSKGLEEIERRAIPADEPLQAALIAVDPRTGEMTAMVGGRNYGQTRFNRAVDAIRQPGSAFKPFVLLTAISQSLQGKQNLTLSSMVSGEPISLPTPEGIWRPSNFEDEEYGNITIRKAIEHSVNTATTRLAFDIGFKEVLKTARLAGITSHLAPVPSLPLGSFEVSPRELAYAFTTIASGGIRFDSFPLYSVTTSSGDTMISATSSRRKVFDTRATYLTGYALQGVLQRGTAKDARSLGINFQASGKTGTTNGNRDSWFVGYTPEVVCVVWVGYDSGADTGLTGAAGALRIWSRFMRSLYPQAGPPIFVPPQGIETAVIDPESGYLATSECPVTLKEAYLTGTVPKETCPDHPVNPVVDTIRDKVQDAGKFFRNLFR